MDHAFGTHLN
uniref:Uncharacterized protein n=1 Tax=Rhizophora mucronata TaxID=61149 RepID=A0A2P2NN09_RHIMU